MRRAQGDTTHDGGTSKQWQLLSPDFAHLFFPNVLLGRLLERPLARLSAEVIGRALMDGGGRRPLLVHHHPADRIFRHHLPPFSPSPSPSPPTGGEGS